MGLGRKKQKSDEPSIPEFAKDFPEELLAKYSVQDKELGSGNFATVYLVLHKRTGKRRALKVMVKRRHATAAEWHRESNMLTLLRHPHIVRFYDCYEDSTHLYMVLEYCAGGDLFWYIQAKVCLSEQESKKFALQLLSALDYCQANLIAHRDIKLENLLLDSKGKLKLADFGFARSVEGHSNTLLGSPIYTAVEILCGQSYNPLRSDAWSLGVVLCCMVFGGFPFVYAGDEKEYIATVRKHGNAKLSRLEKNGLQQPVSVEFQQLAKALLQPEPELRLRIDQVLDSDWLKQEQRIPSGRTARGTPQNLDAELVASVAELGFEKGEIERAVIADDAEKLAHAIYHLLLERKQELVEPKGVVRRDSAPSLHKLKGSDQKRSWSSSALLSKKQKKPKPVEEPSTPPPLLRKRTLKKQRNSVKSVEFE